MASDGDTLANVLVMRARTAAVAASDAQRQVVRLAADAGTGDGHVIELRGKLAEQFFGVIHNRGM